MAEDPADMHARFRDRYRMVGEPVLRRIEARAIGADYGATSYTTRDQADRLGDLLGLAPGQQLLEVGAGSGWPGIYLAKTTGCRVVLTDLPPEGLVAASRRVHDEAVNGTVIAASGEALPFAAATFDAVSSSDVFC